MSNPTADLIEFPGEPTFRAGSAVPPVRVRLPLEADPRRGVLATQAVSWGLMAVIMMTGATALVSVPVPPSWAKAAVIWAFAAFSVASSTC